MHKINRFVSARDSDKLHGGRQNVVRMSVTVLAVLLCPCNVLISSLRYQSYTRNHVVTKGIYLLNNFL